MKRSLITLTLSALLGACSHHPPMATVDYVDLDKFMGDWYVIAQHTDFHRGGGTQRSRILCPQ